MGYGSQQNQTVVLARRSDPEVPSDVRTDSVGVSACYRGPAMSLCHVTLHHDGLVHGQRADIVRRDAAQVHRQLARHLAAVDRPRGPILRQPLVVICEHVASYVGARNHVRQLLNVEPLGIAQHQLHGTTSANTRTISWNSRAITRLVQQTALRRMGKRGCDSHRHAW